MEWSGSDTRRAFSIQEGGPRLLKCDAVLTLIRTILTLIPQVAQIVHDRQCNYTVVRVKRDI